MSNTPHVVGDRHRSGERNESQETPADRPPITGMNPAAKLIYIVLEQEGALATSELAAETRLKPKTVRRRVARLNGTGHVRSRPRLSNPNEKVHELRPAPTETAGETDV